MHLEKSGGLFSELLYQIELKERKKPPGRVTGWVGRLEMNCTLSKILDQKEESGDLTESEVKQFRSYILKRGKINPTTKRMTGVDRRQL